MAEMTLTCTLARRAVPSCVCVLAILCLVSVGQARGGVRYDSVTGGVLPSMLGYAATVEQCTTSAVQSERSATFTAQIEATAQTQRMGIKFELQQRLRGETEYHTLTAPGLGEWRAAEPGVKIYKYVKQVTNLSAPASYRALVRFRWLDAKGHVIKRTELHTPRCLQLVPPTQITATPTPSA